MSPRTPLSLLAAALAAVVLAALPAARSGPVTVIVPPVTLDQPGTYVLAADVTVSMGNAIIVTSPDVIIDLCGFTIDGDDNNAAAILASIGRLTVRNGRFTGWAVAVVGGHGSTLHDLEVREGSQGLSAGEHSRVERCRLTSLTLTGISVGERSIVRDCMVENTSGAGRLVSVGGGCLVQRVATVGGAVGIGTGRGCVVEECTASEYTSAGFELQELSQVRRSSAFLGDPAEVTVGFHLRPHASLVDCSAGSSGTGIEAEGGNLVRGATVFDCKTGINAHGGARIEHSLVSDCVLLGILAQGPGVDVVGCTVIGGDSNGVRFGAPGCTISASRVEGTAGTGIELDDACVARDNVLHGNFGVGICARGDRTRVEDNTLESNAVGIAVLGQHALVIRNRATGSTTADFQVAGLQFLGPILQTAGWLTGASPHANFRTPLF